MPVELTEEEGYVILLAKLNEIDKFQSLDVFREVMRISQNGGKDEDPIDDSIDASFQFDGDFEQVVDGLVDKGLLELSNGSYKLSSDGIVAWRHNSELVSIDDLNVMRVSKRLYNER